ncbi:GMC family oxidoreductase [Paraburkholderia tuberum]|uniref:Choline dehydrogenase n=1 Tax=Paraburkholderia tuberum TaxID=157910 RepID=A0A1H1KIT2_9BURK|nr:GMC family oxidoreductase N-terminal domain-containing protein [Paraburkholderia tuberum]SDR61679.1 choline dehydrogenase [Paraburkholderia tuberum]
MKQSTSPREAKQAETFDYVVVGAGSAGCVLARALTEDPTCTVLLLEAGPDIETFWIRTPAGVPFLFHNKDFNWCYSTEPENSVGGRSVYFPRGKVVGGSSAINGMLYMRGDRQDYDDWARAGNPGWGYDDVLPYFRRAEKNDRGADAWRGDQGPLRVSLGRHQHPITQTFIETAAIAGIATNADFAGAKIDGAGYCQHTIGDGVRSSVARAYLHPVRSRANLAVRGNALVHRVVIENRVAKGVIYERDGVVQNVRARREVILSAGVIGTPQILMLSGVGRTKELADVGIRPVHELSGVGQNLQDHYAVNTVFEVKRGYSMNPAIRGWKKYLHGARYLLDRGGPLSMGTSHAQAFVATSPGDPRPDVQISFRPWSFTFEASGALRVHPFPGIQIAALKVRPASRGTVSLKSPAPSDAPRIRANYLSAREDQETMIRAFKLVRRLATTGGLAQAIVQEEFPGPGVDSDADMLEFIRDNGQSIYHPVGTCKMGCGNDAVVDARLRVHGIGQLRVVDASIMPNLISGNTNAPTIMIAEKAADMVIEDAKATANHEAIIH